MRKPNYVLRRARLGRLSPSGSGRAMSRQELAEAVNRYVFEQYGRVTVVSARWVGSLESGRTRWPRLDYRAGLRAVLGAPSDAALGLFSVRRFPVDAAYEGWLAEQSGEGPTPVDGGTAAASEAASRAASRAAALAGWDVPAVGLGSGLGEAPGVSVAPVLDAAAAVQVTVPAGVRVTIAYADAGADGGCAPLRVAVVDGQGRTVEAVPVPVAVRVAS